MRLSSGVVLCLLVFAQSSFAGVVVTPLKPIVASPVEVRIDVDLGPDVTIRQPDRVSLPEWVNLISLKLIGGAGKKEIVLTVESYKTGEIKIPAIEYEVISHDGSVKTQATEPISFTVVSVRTDPATADKVKDIRGVADLKLNWWSYLWPFLALVALAATIFLLWRKFFKGRKREIKMPSAPPLPSHEIAYDKLTKLQAEDLFGKGLVKEHFFSLSEIVREYIEGRFNTPALERTTFELEKDFRSADKTIRTQLFLFLNACDVVKFAKGGATREQADTAVRRAFEFIDSTKPVPKEDVA